MREKIQVVVLYVVMVFVIWGVGTLFAKSVSDYEVISPEPGVECVIVSRMFNTSVDCWVTK